MSDKIPDAEVAYAARAIDRWNRWTEVFPWLVDLCAGDNKLTPSELYEEVTRAMDIVYRDGKHEGRKEARQDEADWIASVLV